MSEAELKSFNERYTERWYLIIFLFLAATVLTLVQCRTTTPVYAEVMPVVYVAPAAVAAETVISRGNFDRMALPDPSEADGAFKAYMDYRKITDRTSKQWLLQQLCTTDAQGFRRFNGFYIVAVGSYYSTDIGQELRVTLSSGIVFSAIVGDLKKDIHTDAMNQYAANGNIVEFIVDTAAMEHTARIAGDVTAAGLFGAVESIEIKN